MQHHNRQLAAILFTDIVGYTELMQKNEQQAVDLIRHYDAALKRSVDLHNGQVLNYYGDGSLCTFPSVIEAINCAIELQKELQTEPNVPLRIGLHVGEVLFENKNALGDGVNIASRIQSLGQANTILFSKEIVDKIKNHPEFRHVSLGLFDFKNVDQPMEVFALIVEGLIIPQKETMEGKLKLGLPNKRKGFRKKIIIAAVMGLLLAAAFFLYSKSFHKPGFTGKEKSIAVLPFTNLSNDKENEYFSDGLTEEITTQLSKIADLKVIARTSSALYKGSNKSIKQISEELDVASVLEGSVQKTGDNIRITAQLIDARTQSHIWAEKYDREFKEVFSIQSEVAEAIAYQLNAKLTREEKKKIEKITTNNPEAYQYYLQGNNIHWKFFETRSLEYYTTSKALFEKALSLDSNYALAHAALADLYNTYTNSIKKDSALISLQIKESEKAYSIDSTLDLVNYVRGQILFSVFGKYEEAYIYFRRALEINPNDPNNLFGLASILWNLGLNDESITVMNKAIKLDPLIAGNFDLLATNELDLYRSNDAVRNFQAALQLEPGYYAVINSLIFAYSLQNKLDSAGMMLEKASKLRPADQPPAYQIAYYYAKSGNRKKALEINTKIRHVRVYLALGMKEEALNKLFENETFRRPFYNNYLFLKNHLPHKDFDLIRNDPRFLQLIEKKRIQYELNKKKFSIAGSFN